MQKYHMPKCENKSWKKNHIFQGSKPWKKKKKQGTVG
jgi:hypothetical protein